MVERKHGTEYSREEQVRRHLQVLYASRTREKQIFLEDLKAYRRRKGKEMLNAVIVSVGPKWYQTLSVKQRSALDNLESSIYQDLLEGRPYRSASILHKLGLVPCPQYMELMHCLSLGRNDPKEMLAELYLATYGYPINGKRTSYCLNARLILSAILYLGLKNLIYLLEKTFAPDISTAQSEPKPKPKRRVKQSSPYLHEMVAVLYEPPRLHRKQPLPLPDLTELNQPYEEEPFMTKPPPPPPPPPPPKKRLPISYCEQLAGINPIKAHVSPTDIPSMKKNWRPKGKQRTKHNNEGTSKKKKYGIETNTQKKKTHRKKLVAPQTSLWNYQYSINGVFKVRGKTCFVLANVSVLPAQGELIHGGYASVNGDMINIHCGYRGLPPDVKPDTCDCVKQWQDAVFLYAKKTKCTCGHYYDFGNDENRFSQEELPYFTKPSRQAPLSFHYDTIYDLDSQRLHIKKTFKKVWETESTLRVDEEESKVIDKKKKKKKAEKDSKKDGDNVLQAGERVDDDAHKVIEKKNKKKAEKDSKKSRDNVLQAGERVDDAANKVIVKKKKKKKAEKHSKKDATNVLQAGDEAIKVKRYEASQTCLGMRPKICDYLKCALQLMRKVNVAAHLPDLHLVPELKEWMRHRLYGKFTDCEKKEYLRKSTMYWSLFKSLAGKGYGHVSPPKEPLYGRRTTWAYKQFLNDSFKPYTDRYKLALFRSHAYTTNLLWRTMYQPEFPDKKFREIYFSYLHSTVDDMHLIHPYYTRESIERKIILMDKRYVCLPNKYEPKT